jgi:selenocysteine lyase/cysteine desulfurase
VRDEAAAAAVAMSALADTAIAHEFPSLDREGLVYLDTGATSQTPRTVLDAMEDYYAHHRDERAPRRLPAGRRGDRALRRRARAHRALAELGRPRRRSSPATSPRR